MSRILILGGSGIISSEITSLAINEGHDVFIVNRGKRKKFIHPDAKVIIADLRNESIEVIQKKINGEFDAVIDVVAYNKDELARNLTLAKGRCKQYFLFSTAVVYKTKEGRYTELDDIGNPDWNYSLNKVECENLLKEKAKEYGFMWTIIRPYITYGKSRIPLQFGPLEYYTIVNRAKAGKIIPVCNREVKCTLTYSKDFAIGLVGLIGNPNAFNQEFHITGNYETTWNDILKKTMKAFGVSYEIFLLDDSDFRNTTLMSGLDANEVYGDKGRNMLFDNSKIKEAVPSFLGETTYDEVLPEIVSFFCDVDNQNINYAWDARIDCMLSKLSKVPKEQKKRLRFAPGANASKTDKSLYFWHRYDLTYFLFRVFRRIKRILKDE